MSEHSEGKSGIPHYTNVAFKVEEQNGVYLSTPIVQTQELSDKPGENLIFRISSVNTCQTTSAVTGPHGTYSSYSFCPNRSKTDELKDFNNHLNKNMVKNPSKNLKLYMNISKDIQELFYNNDNKNSIASLLYEAKKGDPFDILTYGLHDPNSFKIIVINLAHRTDDDIVQVNTGLNYFKEKIDYLQLKENDPLWHDIKDNILSCCNTSKLGPTIFDHSKGNESETNTVNKNFKNKYKLIQDETVKNYENLYWWPCNLFQAAIIACFLNEDDKGTDLNTQRTIWQNIINLKKSLKNENSNLWSELNPFTIQTRAGGRKQDQIEKLKKNPHIKILVTKSSDELDEEEKKLVREGETYVEYQEEEFDEKIVIEFFIVHLYKNTSKNYRKYIEYLMNLAINIFNTLDNSQHGTQLPIFALKNKNITLKDPVISMNGFISLIDSKILRYIYHNNEQRFKNYKGKHSGLKPLEMAEIIEENILGDLANHKVSADLSEQKVEELIEITELTEENIKKLLKKLREKYFGSIIEEDTIDDKKYYKIISPACYNPNVKPEDLIASDIAEKYIPSDFSSEQVSDYLIKNKFFRYEEDFNRFKFSRVLDKNFPKVAKENYYTFHIKWIKKDSEKLCHIPNSLFGLLDANDIENMDEDQQKILFLNYNGEDVLKDKIPKIKPQVLEIILAETIANSENNENTTEEFDQKFINCIPYFTKKQINALTFSNLSTNFLNNILLLQFDLIKDEKFQEIDLNSINIIYCSQILEKKLDCLDEDKILSLNANISKELPIEILINMIDKNFRFSESFFKGINISILKTKLFAENRSDLYIKFFENNFDNFSIEQLITINVEKDFNDDESLKQKINERLKLTNDPLYVDVFKINNYAISQKNLLPESSISNFLKNTKLKDIENLKTIDNKDFNFWDYIIIRRAFNHFKHTALTPILLECFNAWKYILEHFESFSDFINDFFLQSEDEIQKCIGFNQIFAGENLSQLIPLFDTSRLSMNNLNTIINLFFSETNENQDDENQNKSKKTNFSGEQLINIPNWKELSTDSLKKIFINNKTELLNDISGKIKNSIKAFFENEIDYEKVFEIILYAPPELFKDSLCKINMKKLKEFYDKDPQKITEVMNKNILFFTEQQIRDFGLNDKDGFTYPFVLKRIDILNESEMQNVKIKVSDGTPRPTLMTLAIATKDKAQGQEEIKLKLNILKNLPATEFVKIRITANKFTYINNFDVFFSQLKKLKKDDFNNSLVKNFVNDLIKFNLFGLLIKIYEHTDELKEQNSLDIINDLIKNKDLTKGETDQKFIEQLFKLEEVGNLNNLSPEMKKNLAIYIAGNFSNFIVLLNETDKSKPKFQTLIQFFVIIVNTLNNNSSNDEFKNEILNKIQSTNIENENDIADENDTVEQKKVIKNKLFEVINYCFKQSLFENNSNYLILEIIQALKLPLEYNDIKNYFISDQKNLAKAISLINITLCSLEDLKTIIDSSNETVKFSNEQLIDISKRKDFYKLDFDYFKKLIEYSKKEMNDEVIEIFFQKLFNDEKNTYSIKFSNKNNNENYKIYKYLSKFANKNKINYTLKDDYYYSYTLNINKNFDKLLALYDLGLKEISKEIFELPINDLYDFKDFCLNISPYLRNNENVDKKYKPDFQTSEITFFKMLLDNVDNISNEQINIFKERNFESLNVSNSEIINLLIQIINKLSNDNIKSNFCKKLPIKILFIVCLDDNVFNYIASKDEKLNQFLEKILKTDRNEKNFNKDNIFKFLSKNPQNLLTKIFELKIEEYKKTKKFENNAEYKKCKEYEKKKENLEELLKISKKFINQQNITFNNSEQFNTFFNPFFKHISGKSNNSLNCNSLEKLVKANIENLSLDNFKLIANKMAFSSDQLNSFPFKGNLSELENEQLYQFIEKNIDEIKKLDCNYFESIFNSRDQNDSECIIKKIIIFYFGISLEKFSYEDIIEIKNFCNNNEEVINEIFKNNKSNISFEELIEKNKTSLSFPQILATGLYENEYLLQQSQEKFTTCFENKDQKAKFKNKEIEDFFIKNSFNSEVDSQTLFSTNINLNVKDKTSIINLLYIGSIVKISMENDLDLKQNFYNSGTNLDLLQLIFKIFCQSDEPEVNNYLQKYEITNLKENKDLKSQIIENLNLIQNILKNLQPTIESTEIEKIKQNAKDIYDSTPNTNNENNKSLRIFDTISYKLIDLEKNAKYYIKTQEKKNKSLTTSDYVNDQISKMVEAWDKLYESKNLSLFGDSEDDISKKLDELIVSKNNILITDEIEEMKEKIQNNKIDDDDYDVKENIKVFINNLSNIKKLIEEIETENSEEEEEENDNMQFLIDNMPKLPSIFVEENAIETLINNFLLNDFFGVIKYCNDNIQHQFAIKSLPNFIKFIEDDDKISSIKSQFSTIENKSLAQKNLINIFYSFQQHYLANLNKNFYNNFFHIIKNFQFDKDFPIEFLNTVIENSSIKISFSKEQFIAVIAILNNDNLSKWSFEGFAKFLYYNQNNIDENCLNNVFNSNSDDIEHLKKKLLALKYNCINNFSVDDFINITNYYFSENEKSEEEKTAEATATEEEEEEEDNSNPKFSLNYVTEILNQSSWFIPFNTFFKKDENGNITFLNDEAKEKFNKIKIPNGLDYRNLWDDINEPDETAICIIKFHMSELAKLDFSDEDICTSIYNNKTNVFLNKLSELKPEDFENEYTVIFIKDFFEYNLFDLSKYICENKENLSSIIKDLFYAFAHYEHEFKAQKNQIEKDELKKFLLENFNYCIEQNLFDENNETNEEEEENNNLLLKKHYAQELINTMNAYGIKLSNQELNEYFFSEEFWNDNDNDNNKTLQLFIYSIDFKTISPENFEKIKTKLNKNSEIKFSDEQIQIILNNENLYENLIEFLWNHLNTNNKNNEINFPDEQLQIILKNENLSEQFIKLHWNNLMPKKYFKNKSNSLEKKLALYDSKSINLLSLDDIKKIKQNNFETTNYSAKDIFKIIEKLIKDRENKISNEEIIKIIGVGIYYTNCYKNEVTYDFILPYLYLFFKETNDNIEFIDENAKQEIYKLKIDNNSSILNLFINKFKDGKKFAYLIKFPLNAIFAMLYRNMHGCYPTFLQNYWNEILPKFTELSPTDFENNYIKNFFSDYIFPKYLFDVLDYMFNNQSQLTIFDNLCPLIINFVIKIYTNSDNFYITKKINIPQDESTNFKFTNLLFKTFDYYINNDSLNKEKIEASKFFKGIFEILEHNKINLINYENNGGIALKNNEIINILSEKSITELMKVLESDYLNIQTIEIILAILADFNNSKSKNDPKKLTKTQFDKTIGNRNFLNLYIASLDSILTYTQYDDEEIKSKNLFQKFTLYDDEEIKSKNLFQKFTLYYGKKSLLVFYDYVNYTNFQEKDFDEMIKFIETYSSNSDENKYFSEEDIETIKATLEEEKEKFETKKKAREEKRKQEEEAQKKAKEKAEQEKKQKEEKRKQEEADRIAQEEAKLKTQKKAELRAKQEADRKAKEEADRKAKEEADRKTKEEADRKTKEEADRIAEEKRKQEEQKRKQKEEQEKKRKADEEKRKQEEQKKLEEQKRKQEEQKRKQEEEKKAEEEKRKQEEEKKAEEEKRKQEEQKKLEEQKKAEEEKRKQEEADRIDQEKAEQEKLEQERLAQEKAEQEKLEQENNDEIKPIEKNDNDNEIENSEQKLTLEEKLENAILDLETYNYYKNSPNELTQFLVKHLEKKGEFNLEDDLKKYMENLSYKKNKKMNAEFICFSNLKIKAKKALETQNSKNLKQENNDNDLDKSRQNLSENSDEDENKKQMQNISDEISFSTTNSKIDKKFEVEDINSIKTTILRKFLLKLKKALPYIGVFLGIVSGVAAIIITILTFVMPVIGQILGISLFSTFFAIAMASILPSAIKMENNKSEKNSVENYEPEMPTENPNKQPSLINSIEKVKRSNESQLSPKSSASAISEIQNENGEP